jgi:hypothetical protein
VIPPHLGKPYRDPGPATRVWERLNGKAHLEVLAGKAMHPEKGRLVELSLPFGPKPRLILAHLNAEALRTASPEIEVASSLTAFVRRLRLDAKGRNVRVIIGPREPVPVPGTEGQETVSDARRGRRQRRAAR